MPLKKQDLVGISHRSNETNLVLFLVFVCISYEKCVSIATLDDHKFVDNWCNQPYLSLVLRRSFPSKCEWKSVLLCPLSTTETIFSLAKCNFSEVFFEIVISGSYFEISRSCDCYYRRNGRDQHSKNREKYLFRLIRMIVVICARTHTAHCGQPRNRKLTILCAYYTIYINTCQLLFAGKLPKALSMERAAN